jgi:hypothetical protein
MTGTNCDLFTHKQSRSYLNHLVCAYVYISRQIYLYIFGIRSFCYDCKKTSGFSQELSITPPRLLNSHCVWVFLVYSYVRKVRTTESFKGEVRYIILMLQSYPFSLTSNWNVGEIIENKLL